VWAIASCEPVTGIVGRQTTLVEALRTRPSWTGFGILSMIDDTDAAKIGWNKPVAAKVRYG